MGNQLDANEDDDSVDVISQDKEAEKQSKFLNRSQNSLLNNSSLNNKSNIKSDRKLNILNKINTSQEIEKDSKMHEENEFQKR